MEAETMTNTKQEERRFFVSLRELGIPCRVPMAGEDKDVMVSVELGPGMKPKIRLIEDSGIFLCPGDFHKRFSDEQIQDLAAQVSNGTRELLRLIEHPRVYYI